MRNVIKFIPNSITIARIIMSILFVLNIWGQFAYKEEKFINLTVTFVAICFSDLLDGKIARIKRCFALIFLNTNI
ncbi:CDP-alcohol phosphatidyltransferase family protein [Clostridium sp. BSD9I1]|uniref:CDP-alcohol phosphatidyltransferase family protein n=1 Tax=Clostridium sp. BSD9I1 TaxID=2003589 RepID=UPI00164531B5|nr:CDP-alcohol phosphatidyltransferase family protein [Clostridium sp. BSD9I1]